MTWYAAHAVMVLKCKDGIQGEYPLWENIILIHAENPRHAWEKAKIRAAQDEGDSRGTLKYENRHATWLLAGIRKVVECDSVETSPTDGTEVTYSELLANTEEEVGRFASG